MNIKFRRPWLPELTFFHRTEAIASGSSYHRFLLSVFAFSLVASPLMASERVKAKRLPNRSAVVTIETSDKTKRGAAGAISTVSVPHVAPTVTNTADSGIGSLRQALADAQDGDTITFNIPPVSLPNAPSSTTVITLTSGELLVNKNLTVGGPGTQMLTIARDTNAAPFRIFKISSGHTVTMQGLTISGGLAQGTFPLNAGGGIYNDHSTVTLNSCTLSGNSASLGGAVFTNALASGGGTLTLNNSTVSYNSADNSGGGVFSDGAGSGNANLAVISSTLNGNTAIFAGGGIYNSANGGLANMVVSNATLSGNSANSFAGGIYNDGFGGNAALAISNSTLTGNSAGSGGAIYMDGSSSGVSTLHIGNTILNAGALGSNLVNNNGTVVSHGFNLSSDSSLGYLVAADQNGTDPMLGPLKDNGGPTLTHAPLINSPAIDQGKRKTVPTLISEFDQRGFSRPVNDPSVADASGGDGSDIGAVELAESVHPTNAASWKIHGEAGSFAINLPLTGLGLECRSGGANNEYQMVVNFPQPVTFSSAAVTSGVGGVLAAHGETHFSNNGVAGTQVTVDLTGVTNGQIITVALFDVDDGTRHDDVGIRMEVLIGDVNGSGIVNSSDVSQLKLQSGQPVGEENFRADVVANGAINASDVSAVKSKSGTGLP